MAWSARDRARRDVMSAHVPPQSCATQVCSWEHPHYGECDIITALVIKTLEAVTAETHSPQNSKDS